MVNITRGYQSEAEKSFYEKKQISQKVSVLFKRCEDQDKIIHEMNLNLKEQKDHNELLENEKQTRILRAPTKELENKQEENQAYIDIIKDLQQELHNSKMQIEVNDIEAGNMKQMLEISNRKTEWALAQ